MQTRSWRKWVVGSRSSSPLPPSHPPQVCGDFVFGDVYGWIQSMKVCENCQVVCFQCHWLPVLMFAFWATISFNIGTFSTPASDIKQRRKQPSEPGSRAMQMLAERLVNKARELSLDKQRWGWCYCVVFVRYSMCCDHWFGMVIVLNCINLFDWPCLIKWSSLLQLLTLCTVSFFLQRLSLRDSGQRKRHHVGRRHAGRHHCGGRQGRADIRIWAVQEYGSS